MGIGAANSMTGEEADLKMGEMLKFWGPDPVHPTPAAYDLLADSLIDKIADVLEVSAPAPGASSKRRRRESCGPDTRVGWVHTSNTEVGRQAGAGNSGRGGHGYSRERKPARGGWHNKGSGHSGNAGPRGGHRGNAGPHDGYRGNAGHHKRARRGY